MSSSMSRTEAMLFTINPEHILNRLRSVKGVTCELTTHNVRAGPVGLTLVAAKNAAAWIVKEFGNAQEVFHCYSNCTGPGSGPGRIGGDPARRKIWTPRRHAQTHDQGIKPHGRSTDPDQEHHDSR